MFSDGKVKSFNIHVNKIYRAIKLPRNNIVNPESNPFSSERWLRPHRTKESFGVILLANVYVLAINPRMVISRPTNENMDPINM